MNLRLDHVVLWVDDPLRSIAFYEQVVGLKGERVDEFRAGNVLFPSARISPETLIDFMPRRAAPMVNAMAAAEGSAGHPVNHICLSMSEPEYHALRARLVAHGTPPGHTMERSFGAQGLAPQTFYFKDPDGNVLEARYYETAADHPRS